MKKPPRGTGADVYNLPWAGVSARIAKDRWPPTVLPLSKTERRRLRPALSANSTRTAGLRAGEEPRSAAYALDRRIAL